MIVRAPAGTVLPGSSTVYGVRIGAGGSVFPSGTAAGQAAFGVICYAGGSYVAGDIVSIMKKGEIVGFGGSAGSPYYAGVGGTLSLTSTNATQVGTTIEGGRLVVDL
jgi:hypothetical protein